MSIMQPPQNIIKIPERFNKCKQDQRSQKLTPRETNNIPENIRKVQIFFKIVSKKFKKISQPELNIFLYVSNLTKEVS